MSHFIYLHYIYIYPFSSIQELLTFQDTSKYARKKEEKLIHDLFYIQETSYTQNKKQILHNGEYQSRQTMKMKNIYYISYFIQIFYIPNLHGYM